MQPGSIIVLLIQYQ